MQFLYINVIYFMLIPSLFLMFLIVTKKEKLLKHFSQDALNKLSLSNQYLSNKARNIMLFIALILMITSLARPVINEKEHESKQNLHSIVLALDISKSMLANDIYPNRLEFAKKKILNFIDNSKDSSIALILFSKNSYIISPLTIDFNSLNTLIENLDFQKNLTNGTNIYSSLETSNRLLKNSSSKNIVLFTDGADLSDFNKEIIFAKEKKLNIYTLAIGTKQGSPIKEKNGDYLTNKNGDIVTVKLNENIKELALESNGGYIKSSLINDDINSILKDIKSKSLKNEFKDIKHKSYTELFYYPLVLALIFIFIAFSSLPNLKRINSMVILLTLLFITNLELKAYNFDFTHIKNAKEAYNSKEYKKAQKEFEEVDSSYEQQYNLANSLYKQGKFKEAIKYYKTIKNEDINKEAKRLHNLGNSYAKVNDFNNAIKTYEEALKFKNDKETKENLETIKKHLQNKQKKNNKSKQNQKKQNNQKKDKQEQKNNSNQKKEKKESSKKQSEENKKTEENKKQEKQKLQKEADKKENISSKEEKRWLNKLNEHKTRTIMKKVENENSKGSYNSPW